jgi:hypothetical protein
MSGKKNVKNGGGGGGIASSGTGGVRDEGGITSPTPHIIVQLPIDINEIQRLNEELIKPKLTYNPEIPKSPRAFEEVHDFAFMDNPEMSNMNSTGSMIANSGAGNSIRDDKTDFTPANELTHD